MNIADYTSKLECYNGEYISKRTSIWYSAQSVGSIEYTDCISVNDTKQSHSEAPAWELWGMWSTPSLSLLSGPEVVASDRVLSMGQIELFDHLNCVQTNN